MKAVVHQGTKNLAIEDAPDARLVEPTDAVIKITTDCVAVFGGGPVALRAAHSASLMGTSAVDAYEHFDKRAVV